MGDWLREVDLGRRTVFQISAGQFHTCARLDDDTVKCWGSNGSGELGLVDNVQRLTPTDAADIGLGRTAIQIATGPFYTCARLDNDTVKCWGNWSGAGNIYDLGPGRTAHEITAGTSHACARLNNDTVKCWGGNASGQLGLGNTISLSAPASLPVELGAGRTAHEIAAGGRHTCARLDNGTVKCWGDNKCGQLGLEDVDS